MIKQLSIYKTQCVDPYRNIATEKYLLDTVQPGCCILYLWQNKNTVVIGRNQNAWAECRTSLLEAEGGHLARRLSGGGAVFHDLGNLNFTFIMHQEDYNLDRQLSVIETACAYAGIAVERSGRNDLLANGQKFSGNAFYHSQGRAYHHGTLLVDADMDKLGRYLTPPKAKLEAKGVESVRSRVINLQALAPALTCQALAQYMAQAFGVVYGLCPEYISEEALDAGQIATQAQELSDWQWLYGPKLPFSLACSDRFSWGSIQLQLQVDAGCIAGVQVYSDVMDWLLAEQISQALTGCRFTAEAIRGALADVPHQADLCALLARQIL